MSTTYRFAGMLVLLLAMLAAALAIAARPASAAGTTIDCEAPSHIECTISNPDGIAHVTVTMMTGLGPIAVVDKSYNCLSEVTVSWDPIVPNAYFDVETCDGLHFAPSTRDDGRSGGNLDKLAVEARSEPIVGFVLLLYGGPDTAPELKLSAEQVQLHDFDCGGEGQVPCDQTFSVFCAKIAKGNEIPLDSGGGACITPGGVNPDGAP
jgi:hypothetical protein